MPNTYLIYTYIYREREILIQKIALGIYIYRERKREREREREKERESGGWLSFPKVPQHHMTDQEVKTSIRLRMNLDVFVKHQHENLACAHKGGQRINYRVCNDFLDVKGLHALLCKLGGHVVRRHNRIRDLLAKLIQDRIDATVHIEQHLPGLQPDDRHPDVDFINYRNVRQYIDVEIVTPHPRALPGDAALHKAGSLIETGESTKRRKYSMVPLLPAVMSHLGRFGTGMQTIIKSVNRQPKDAERSAAIVEMYQAIGVEVQKANVAQLQAAGTLM